VLVLVSVLSCGHSQASEIQAGGAVSLTLTGLTVTRDPGAAWQIRFTADRRESPAATGHSYMGEAINRALEFFLLGVGVPDEKFWVNLAPADNAQSIDPALADTDLGKILLAADLKLKKDTSSLTNPRKSPNGRKYWDRLYAKAVSLGIDEMPIANRVWITQGPVSISEDAGSVRILESSLEVRLEADYMPGEHKNMTAKQRQLQDYARVLMSELIVPDLNRKVNEGAAYEDLRQAHRAMILARWYKERFCRDRSCLLRQLSEGLRSAFPSRLPYTQAQIHREYMASLSLGDYDFSDNTTNKLSAYMELITRRYFSGGIDWRSTVFKRKSETNVDQGALPDSGFNFLIILDSGRPRPLEYAMQSIKILSSDASSAEAGYDAGFNENLPPISSVDMIINGILKQDHSVHRAMSRNL